MANGEVLSVVLYAEDDPDDQLIMTEAFRAAGSSIALHIVDDGQQLLSRLRRESLESGRRAATLVLLDLNMPRVDGREALIEMKTDRDLKTIPVVVYTTSGSPSDVASSYRIGAASYVQKPRNYADVLGFVHYLIGYWDGYASFSD